MVVRQGHPLCSLLISLTLRGVLERLQMTDAFFVAYLDDVYIRYNHARAYLQVADKIRQTGAGGLRLDLEETQTLSYRTVADSGMKLLGA